MAKTMAVVFAVSVNDPFKLVQFSFLRMSVMKKAPKAPTPAVSVGVKQPRYNPPMTRKKRRRTPHVPLSDKTFFFMGKQDLLWKFFQGAVCQFPNA